MSFYVLRFFASFGVVGRQGRAGEVGCPEGTKKKREKSFGFFFIFGTF
jgi:hypothetical protein